LTVLGRQSLLPPRRSKASSEFWKLEIRKLKLENRNGDSLSAVLL